MMRSEKKLGIAVISVLTACAMLFFFPADSAMENPGDPNDTQGVPAVSIYLVLLMMLTAASMVLTGIGSIIQRVLRRRSLKLRIGVHALANASLAVTSLLGGMVSLAYLYDAVSGILAALLFLFSFALVLLSTPQRLN